MKKVVKWAAGLLVMVVACCMFLPVQAAGETAVVEKYTSENGVVLYIKGLEVADWEAEYQVGTVTCTVESISLLQETEEPVYTLILWDNSRSVMNKNEETIKSILIDIVANRAPGEKFAIALLGEELDYLTDYSSDYSSLKQMIEGTESENKTAYFIENLYKAVQSFNDIPDTGYKRIIVISDGVDATQTGYSERELLNLLEKNTYLVYSIGVDGGDTQALQSMFSISRTTNAGYYNLGEIEETMDVVKSLGEDYSIVQVKAAIPDELQDGSTQNSRIVLTAGQESHTLQCQVTLPFINYSPAEDEQPTQAPKESEMADETNETAEPETVPALSQNTLEGFAGNSDLLIGIGCSVVVLILVVVFIVILAGRKKKEKVSGNDYAKLDQQIKNERAGRTPEPAVTSHIPVSPKVEQHKSETDGNKTMLLFDEQDSAPDATPQGNVGKRLILTAVSDPAKAYQCSIIDSIVIGRKPTACNLAIATDDAVSERHCEISVVQNKFYVKDLQSSNGTYVNGKKIDTVTEISSGCLLRIGRVEYSLTIQ